jgi:MSHA biogenesis protein MshO
MHREQVRSYSWPMISCGSVLLGAILLAKITGSARCVCKHKEKGLKFEDNLARQQHAGFTLIEMIMVILLLGIIGVMGGEMISAAFKGFSDTDARMEIFEEGKLVLMRMEREIHIALPNAVYIDGDTIEIGVIDENAMTGVFGQYTEASPTGGTTITDRTASLPENTLVSIYNTSWNDFAVAANSRVYQVRSSGINPMTLDRNIGTASPYGRYYAVRPEAVRFAVASGVLTRSTATVTVGGDLGAFGGAQILAKNITQNGTLPFFTYNAGTSTRNSVVIIHFTISNGAETVNFHKVIQVRNVP